MEIEQISVTNYRIERKKKKKEMFWIQCFDSLELIFNQINRQTSDGHRN